MFKEFDLKRFWNEKGISVLCETLITFCFVQGMYYFSESKAGSDVYVLLQGIYKLLEGLIFAFFYMIYLIYTDGE